MRPTVKAQLRYHTSQVIEEATCIFLDVAAKYKETQTVVRPVSVFPLFPTSNTRGVGDSEKAQHM